MTKKKENKEQTITYSTEECKHEHLTKIDGDWFFCDDCGLILKFMFCWKMDLNKASDYLNKTVEALVEKKDEIKKSIEKREEYEKEMEKKAIENYKKQKKKDDKGKA